MIAAATMYEVSTQLICSCVAESSPPMRGRATLAMVWSSACRKEASITEIVISPRFNPGPVGLFATTVGVHCHPRTQAGLDRNTVLESQAHRQSLHHLHPVSGSVFRRQQ